MRLIEVAVWINGKLDVAKMTIDEAPRAGDIIVVAVRPVSPTGRWLRGPISKLEAT